MTADQMIGYTLKQSTALSVITSTRIYHGMRPESTVTPCVNYFRSSGGSRVSGFDRVVFSLNCRASTAILALSMAKIITDIFQGSSGRGMYGSINGFEVTRSMTGTDQGLVFEDTDKIYNAPVDVQIFHPTSSVT